MRTDATAGNGRGRRAISIGAAVLALGAGVAVAAQVDEVEPNGSTATATPIAPYDFGAGAISPAADHDFFVTTGATAGHQIFAMVETASSTASKDALLVAYDDAGVQIAIDDNDGPGSAPALAGDAVPISGDVFFEIYEQNNDGEITPYRLFQLIADPAASIPEVEPNDTPAQATPVTRQSLATGNLASGETDFFAIPLESGEELAVILDRDPDANSTFFSSRIDVFDTDGTSVLASGDLVSGDVHAAGPVAAAAAGTYFVRITHGGGGSDDDYRVAFVTTVPEPVAAASAIGALGALGALSRRGGRARSQA